MKLVVVEDTVAFVFPTIVLDPADKNVTPIDVAAAPLGVAEGAATVRAVSEESP